MGNPVLPGTGRKLHDERDYAGAGIAPLEVRRYYRSVWTDGAAASGLSPVAAWSGGWKLNWNASLASASPTEMRAFHPDGTTVAFVAQATTPVTWAAQGGSRDSLTELVDAAGQRTGWSLRRFADDATEAYDAQGRLQSETARNGWIMTLAYDGAGRLASVRNAFGRQLAFAYDATGRLATLTTPGGEITSYGYDANNNLTTVTWPDGNLRRYHYEDARFLKALTGITDEGGVRIGSYAYDGQGRVTDTVKAGGAERITLSYPAADQTVVTDYASGSAQSRTYSFANQAGVLRPTAVSAPCSLCGSTAQVSSYDAAGNKTREVAHDGTVTFYKYNERGQETERATFAASFQSATTRPALANASAVTSTQWHATFNLPKQVAEPGKISAWSYNSKGMMTGASWVATTDATGASKFTAARTGSTYATGWGYNASSLVTSVVQKTDGTETARYTLKYNASGDLTSITEPATGKIARGSTYDAHGALLSGTDLDGAVVASTYGPRGHLTQTRFDGMVTTYSRNAAGLLTAATSPSTALNVTYDPAHRVTAVTTNITWPQTVPQSTISPFSALPSWLQRYLLPLIPSAHAQAVLPVPAPPGGVFGPRPDRANRGPWDDLAGPRPMTLAEQCTAAVSGVFSAISSAIGALTKADSCGNEPQKPGNQDCDDKCQKWIDKARSEYHRHTTKRIPTYLSGGLYGPTVGHYEAIIQLQRGLRKAIDRVRQYCNPLPMELAEWERAANMTIPVLH